MAKCNWCKLEMNDNSVNTCTGNKRVVFPVGSSMPAVAYAETDHRCHDCNIGPGGFHHPGCDMERCPKCGGQLIGCGCLDEPEED